MDRNILPQIIYNSIRFSAIKPEIINMLVSKLDEIQLSNFLSTNVIKRVIELLFTKEKSNDDNYSFFGEDWLTYLMELDYEINSMGLGEQFEFLYSNYCNHYLDVVGIRGSILGNDALDDELDIEQRASLRFVKLVWFMVSNISSYKNVFNDLLFSGGSNMNLSAYDENQPIGSVDGDLSY